ncbi:SAE1 enzyme, partial [Pitta sordida]|nr:SAE1 enzyme [Pitta sordida]
VCLTCCSRESMVRINQICHKNGVKFFTGDVFGYHGFTFADLGVHEFIDPIPTFPWDPGGPSPAPPHPHPVLFPLWNSQRLEFCPLREALAVEWRGDKAAAALRRTAPDYFLLQ